jgi:hypothetical protein
MALPDPITVDITPEMISAGASALRGLCPFDFAFPHGGEDEAVELDERISALLDARLLEAQNLRLVEGHKARERTLHSIEKPNPQN